MGVACRESALGVGEKTALTLNHHLKHENMQFPAQTVPAKEAMHEDREIVIYFERKSFGV